MTQDLRQMSSIKFPIISLLTKTAFTIHDEPLKIGIDEKRMVLFPVDSRKVNQKLRDKVEIFYNLVGN